MPGGKSRYFDEGDVELLEAALGLFPDLDVAAYVAKLARGKVTYPIEDVSALTPLFARGKALRLKDRELTPEHAARFIPKEFFPIASERDLMCKVLLALERGRAFHHLEALGAVHARADQAEAPGPVTHLPTPPPSSAGAAAFGAKR